MSTKMYLPPSPGVSQWNPMSCWAAALESWLQAVNAGRPKYAQDQLVTKYATYKQVGHAKYCGIEPYDLEVVFNDLHIQHYNMNISGRPVRPAFISETLKTKRHLLLIYKSGSTCGHTLVLYGIGYPEGSELAISVMDPAFGGYRNIPFSDFDKYFGQPIVIGFAK